MRFGREVFAVGKPKDYQARAAEACIRFAGVLDEIQGIKPLIIDALEGCDEPFETVVGKDSLGDVTTPQTHLGRYFQNGGRLPVDFFLGDAPDDELGSEIFECEACMQAYALCIRRKKLRQKRGQALRLVRYYGRKAGVQAND